jgi:hypothetical protein
MKQFGFILWGTVLCTVFLTHASQIVRPAIMTKVVKKIIPYLQIKNRSKLPIHFRLIQDGTAKDDFVHLAPNQLKEYVDIARKPCLTQMEFHSYRKIYEGLLVRLKHEKRFVTFLADDKTYYVKWDGEKLRPQEGEDFFSHLTTHGYSLDNNIKQHEIEVERYG